MSLGERIFAASRALSRIALLSSDLKLPPGPDEKFDTAEDLLTWMQVHFERYGDIYRADIYGNKVYVIASPEDVEHVLLTNWQNYIRKGYAIKRISMLLGAGLISSNGEFWVKQRRMLQPAFSRKAVTAQSDVMVAANRELLANWTEAARRGVAVNVTRDVSRMVLKVVLLSIFGEDYARVAPLFEIVSEESRDLEFAHMFSALGKVIVDVASERRRNGSEAADTLGWVMQARDRDRGELMPDAQLAREIMTLIVAGHETTSSVLNWTWFLLSRHPEADRRLAAELEGLPLGAAPSIEDLPNFPYVEQVVEEALRLYPPLWLMTRRSIADDRLGEYFVPAGTEIYISPYFIQRQPRFWPLPDAFDPGRFAGGEADSRPRLATCPFGAGPRNCIGEFFARVEMQLHLIMVARVLRLRNDDARPPEMIAGLNLLSRNHFTMTPEFRPGVPAGMRAG
jgi:cytochrome P450